jgi:uncharacterized protein (DUF2141 family)
MFNLRSLIVLPLLAGAATAAPGAISGSNASACLTGRPSVLVHISGFKRASGMVKLGVYPAGTYLQRRGTVSKDKVAIRSSGPLDVCLPVPGPGRYAVAIHHDVNGNGEKDMSDGAGFSNNPHLSITNLKPSFGRTAVEVGGTPRRVDVILQYRRGLSVGPVAG